MIRNNEDQQSQVAAALDKCAGTGRHGAAAPGGPALGDVYAFPVTAEDGIEWAVVKQHSSGGPLWYIVPYDRHPLVGTWDFAVSGESEARPGALRCGRGIWADAVDMLLGTKSGFIAASEVAAARLRLTVMVGADQSLIPNRSDVDEDPAYDEWMMKATRAACRLEMALRRSTRHHRRNRLAQAKKRDSLANKSQNRLD